MPKDTEFTKIATHYRQLIQDGTLSPGDRMPSMTEVAKKFKVTVTTVNRAYRILKSEGLTTPQPGIGTVVATRPNVAVTGRARIKRMERTGQPLAPGESSSNHWSGLRSVADPFIAEMLDVELHDEIVIRRRVHHREGGPSTLDSSYIHARALGPVPELLQEGRIGTWWQALYKERTGKEITPSPERRTARIVSNSELAELGIDLPPSSAEAVLVVINVFHDEDGPLECWEDVYPPGAWQIDEE